MHATALGYLDLCVAQYTVMDQRASTTDWLLLGSQDVYSEYLIVKVQEDLKGWEKLFASVDVENLSKRLVSYLMYYAQSPLMTSTHPLIFGGQFGLTLLCSY